MNHNYEKLWFEAFAKELLERMFPDEYYDLQLSDKPDIRMGDLHGIEVTRAFYANEAEENRLFDLIKDQIRDKRNEKQNRIVAKIEKLGAKLLYTGEGRIAALMHSSGMVCIDGKQILQAVVSKESKKYDGIVDLFIFSPAAQLPDWFDDYIVEDFLTKLEETAFESIIVYCDHVLHKYTRNSKKYECKHFGKEIYDECSRKASAYAGKYK